MASIQDMIDETEESLRNAPQNIVFARQSAVDNAEPLGSLFANLSPALSQPANTSGDTLLQIATSSARQRAILEGASVGDVLTFNFPTSGALTLPSFTYPTPSSFIFVAYNLDSTGDVSSTINTTDHYIVQDRVTNDLVSVDDSPVPYLSPNAGTPFLPLNIANGKSVNDPNTANTPAPADLSSTRFDFSLTDSRVFSFTEYVPDIFTQVEFVSVTGTFVSGEILVGTANGETSTASVRDFLSANTSRRTTTLNISDLADTEFPTALLVTGQSSGATGIVSTKSANGTWSITSNVNVAVTDRERDLVSSQNYWLKDFNFVIPESIGTGDFPLMTIPTVNSTPKIFKTFPIKQFSDNEIIANMIVITEGLKLNLSFDPFGTADPETSVLIGSQDFRNIFNYVGLENNPDNVLAGANSENISSGQEGPLGNYISVQSNILYPAVGDASADVANQPSRLSDTQNNLYAGSFQLFEESRDNSSPENGQYRYSIYSGQRWNLQVNPLAGSGLNDTASRTTPFPQSFNSTFVIANYNTARSNFVTANAVSATFSTATPPTGFRVNSSTTGNRKIVIEEIGNRGNNSEIDSGSLVYNAVQDITLNDVIFDPLTALITNLNSFGNINDTIVTGDVIVDPNGLSDNGFNSILPDTNTISDFIEIHNYWIASQFTTDGSLDRSSALLAGQDGQSIDFDYNERLAVDLQIGEFFTEFFTIPNTNIYVPSDFATNGVRAYVALEQLIENLDILFEPVVSGEDSPLQKRLNELNVRLGSIQLGTGYASRIYDSVNPMLKGYVEYLQIIIDDLENIQVLYDEITNLRLKRTALLQARGS